MATLSFRGGSVVAKKALEALPWLVGVVESRKRPVTYTWLGERIDAHPFTVVPRSLGLVGSALEKLEPKLGKIPPIQLVVVGGPSGIPGDSGLTWTGVSKEELSSWKGSFFERRPEGSV
jgi:hypothetical protein